MSGSSPLAAQTNPSATRSFNTAEVAPGGSVTVTISLSNVTGNLGVVTETLPSDFAYVSSSLDAAQVSTSGQDVTFTTLGGDDNPFTYNVTASSSVGTHVFDGELAAGGSTFDVVGQDEVEVSASAPPPVTPDPGDGSLSVSSAVDDFGLYLTVSGENSDNPNSKSITLSGSGGVFSGGGDAKAYTAMTTAPSKVGLALAGDYGTAPTNGAVAAWWDSLSDSDKIANLNLDVDQTNGDNDTCDISLCTANAGTSAFGGGDTIRDYAAATGTDQLMITQAFHWDLLSGQEMYNAAHAYGDDSPADYKKAFRGLDADERAAVERFYTAGILERGSGNTLTVTAGDGSDSDGDGRADNVGSSMVVVKVADSDGPDLTDSAHAVGDMFEVSVMYHPLDDIGAITLTAADSSVVVSGGSVTISDTTSGTIATVTAGVSRAAWQQLINYSLDNGSGLAYNIDGGNGTSNEADLVIKAGSSASNASFTVVANEEGRSANRSTLAVSVAVASGNMAPVFDDSALDAATAGVTILEFMAGGTVTSSGLPINFGASASDSDNQVLSYSIAPMNKGLMIDSATGVVSVDNGTGVAHSDGSSVEYTVTVSDGTLSDSYSFSAAITTNMATANTDDDRVTSATTAAVTVGSATEGVPQDGRNVPVVDLAGLLNPVHDVSALTIQITAPTGLPFTLDGTELQLASVPDARPSYVLTYSSVVITFDDGYDGDGPDLTLTLSVTVHVAEPPTVGAIQRAIDIDENESGVLADTANLYDAMGSGVTPYYHYTAGTGSGMIGDNGQSDFSVDTGTGEVTLDMAQDYEDGVNSHTLTIFVRDGDEVGSILSVINIAVSEGDVNEAPVFMASAPSSLGVAENAQPGTTVGDPITADDQDAGDSTSYSISESSVPFSVDSYGQISVSGALDLTASPYTVTLVATDSGGMTDEHELSITVGDINDPPKFDPPAQTTASIPENTAAGTVVATYNATDVDGSDTLEGIHYELRDADDLKNFDIMVETSSDGEIMGKLVVKDGANLDVDADGAATSYTVEVNVKDADDADSELVIVITVTDVNDNAPMFTMESVTVTSIRENDPRGTAIGRYIATDGDLTAPNNEVTYSIDNKSFHIDSSTGMLTVLESLDFESGTPCTTCVFKVTATDDGDPTMTDTLDVTLIVQNAEDSVSTFTVSKANPVPGVSMGAPDSALADTKTGMYGIPERPSDQPATEGSAPVNFVETDWASWDTVLRIAVTSQSPNAECGVAVANQNNNQCVYLDVESDSAGNKLRLAAYRSATQENLFVAAVMVVEKDPTDDGDDSDGDRNNRFTRTRAAEWYG